VPVFPEGGELGCFLGVVWGEVGQFYGVCFDIVELPGILVGLDEFPSALSDGLAMCEFPEEDVVAPAFLAFKDWYHAFAVGGIDGAAFVGCGILDAGSFEDGWEYVGYVA